MISSLSSFPHIYVINLKHAVERREKMTQQLNNLGVAFSFVEGIDGRAADYLTHTYYDRKKRLRWHGRDLLSTEVACVLSHRAAYQQALTDGHSHAMLLEDDILLEPDFVATIQAAMAVPVAWDIIRLIKSAKTQRRSRMIAPLYGPYWLSRPLSTPGTGHAYIFTAHAAQVLLNHSARSWMPIDVLLGYVWQTGLNVLSIQPAPIDLGDETDSYIGQSRFSKKITLTGWRRAFFPLNRCAFRFYELLGKRSASVYRWRQDKKTEQRLIKKKE